MASLARRGPLNRSQVAAAIKISKVAHLVVPLEQVILPAIDVKLAKGKSERTRPVGSSRFGGLPDLPIGSKWPTVDGIPLMFVGQFNMKGLARLTAASVLPNDGLLSFFFDATLTGYERGEKVDRCRVVFTATAATTLIRLSPPAIVPALFAIYRDAVPVFENAWTLPEFEEVDGDEFPTIPAIMPIICTTAEMSEYQKYVKNSEASISAANCSGMRTQYEATSESVGRRSPRHERVTRTEPSRVETRISMVRAISGAMGILNFAHNAHSLVDHCVAASANRTTRAA